MPHVFISYLRENGDVVDRLAGELKSRGVTVWLDRNDIEPGAVRMYVQGVSARFVQNRTLTGVGRATQPPTKPTHWPVPTLSRHWKAPVPPQAERLREPRDCSRLFINRLNAVLFAPSEQSLFHRTVFEFIPSFQHTARMQQRL